MEHRIKAYGGNPFYWEYGGKSLLLLGGSIEDNIFQVPEMEKELDRLAEAGGNYLRCTISSRDEGNVWAYHRDTHTGKYDLSRWNDEFWRRLKDFLDACEKRDIVAQIEIWATYDFYERGDRPWRRNPFNPACNINYTPEESGLPYEFDSNGCTRISPFFETVPNLSNNKLVLQYQHGFVDKLLSISLSYDNVLYCIDNETNAHPEWGLYWAHYIRRHAGEKDHPIEVTEMWDVFDPTKGAVEQAFRQDEKKHPFSGRSNVFNTIARPDVYSFVDISNHNAQRGRVHYETGSFIRNKLKEEGTVRPVTCVKIYGGPINEKWCGGSRDGEERFWRNIFAGISSSRFHRPPWGIALDDNAVRHIRSMRMFEKAVDIVRCEPRQDLLHDESDREIYCLADEGTVCALLCIDAPPFTIDCRMEGSKHIQWLDVMKSEFRSAVQIGEAGTVRIEVPGKGIQVAVIEKG